MKRKSIKSILLSFVLLNCTFSQCVFALDSERYTIDYSKGVTYERTVENQNYNVNVLNSLKIDLNEPSLDLDLIFNEDKISNKITAKDILNNSSNSKSSFTTKALPDTTFPSLAYSVESDFNSEEKNEDLNIDENYVQAPDDIISSINGDFFLLSTPSSSVGTMVKNGKLYSSKAERQDTFGNLVIRKDSNGQKRASIEYFVNNDTKVVLKNETKNKSFNIDIFNKLISENYSGVLIRTSDFMSNTIGTTDDKSRVEIIVSPDNTVKDVRIGKEKYQLQNGEYAIISSNLDFGKAKEIRDLETALKKDSKNKEEIQNKLNSPAYALNEQNFPNSFVFYKEFNVGDKVSYTMPLLENDKTIDTIIGGGSILIKDSENKKITRTAGGKCQRTAAYIKDNELYFFTNEGRNKAAKGLSEKDLQTYFKMKGAKDAIVFDGGGSTFFTLDGENKIETGENRKVINALALKNISKDEIKSIEATNLARNIYEDEPFKVMIVAKDENENKIGRYNSNAFQFYNKLTGETFPVENNSLKLKLGENDNIDSTQSTLNLNVKLKDPNGNFSLVNEHNEALNNFVKEFKVNRKIKDPSYNINLNSMDFGILLNNNEKAKNQISKIKNALIVDENLGINNTLNNKNNLQNISIISLNNNDTILKGKSIETLEQKVQDQNNNLLIFLDNKKMNNSYEQNIFDSIIEKSNKNIYVLYKNNNDPYEKYILEKRGKASYLPMYSYEENENKLNYINIKQVNGSLQYNYKILKNVVPSDINGNNENNLNLNSNNNYLNSMDKNKKNYLDTMDKPKVETKKPVETQNKINNETNGNNVDLNPKLGEDILF